jgi:hypothetical protein
LAHRSALALLAAASVAALLAFCGGGTVGPWLAVLAGALFPVSLILLGAARWGRLAVLILVVGIVLAAGLALAVFLPEGGPDVLGLPLGTALMIFVVVPVPLLLTCLAYAFTFDRLGLRQEDLDRVRAAKEKD